MVINRNLNVRGPEQKCWFSGIRYHLNGWILTMICFILLIFKFFRPWPVFPFFLYFWNSRPLPLTTRRIVKLAILDFYNFFLKSEKKFYRHFIWKLGKNLEGEGTGGNDFVIFFYEIVLSKTTIPPIHKVIRPRTLGCGMVHWTNTTVGIYRSKSPK